jgi:serine/threonine protein phosphatase PrpC
VNNLLTLKRGYFMGNGYRLEADSFSESGDRRMLNEDAVFWRICDGPCGELGLFLVADGVGGLDFGDEASRAVADEFEHWWESEFLDSVESFGREIGAGMIEEYKRSLYSAALAAHESIRRLRESSDKGAGSTLSLLLFLGESAIVLHIGDSRIYRLQSRQLSLLTQDHTLVADMVRRNEITPKQALTHPRRNVITRCVGSKTVPIPQLYHLAVACGDSFLLCTDGLHGYACEKGIGKVLRKKRLPIDKKILRLRALVKEGLAKDNLSAVLLNIVKD